MKHFVHVEGATLTIEGGYSDNRGVTLTIEHFDHVEGATLTIYQHTLTTGLPTLDIYIFTNLILVLPPEHVRKRADKWGIKVQPS
jgi:hypothetical protein